MVSLEPPPKNKKRRYWLLAVSILVGMSLGIAAVAYGTLVWAKNYVDSAEFWKDASKKAGVELSAASSDFTLFPPQLIVSGFEAKRGTQKLITIQNSKLSLAFSSILTLVLDVKIYISGVEVFQTVAPDVSGSEKKSALQFPSLPFRRIDFEVYATDIQTPIRYLPRLEGEIRASLAIQDQKAVVEIGHLRAMGLQAKGQLAVLPSQDVEFSFEFPEKASMVSGSVSGVYSRTPYAKGELKLPNMSIPLPSGTQWLVGSTPVILRGSTQLGGGLSFIIQNQSWSAQAVWDLNLTQTHLSYGVYEKPAGKTANISGKFDGNASQWKLTETEAAFGDARAQVDASYQAGQGIRLNGSLPSFEIAEFVPLFLKSMPDVKPKISGKAAAHLDLLLPENAASEPSGRVALSIDNWNIDAITLLGLVGIAEKKDQEVQDQEATGQLLVKGKVEANLDRGRFKESAFRLNFDASSLGLRFGEYFHKKSGRPLVVDFLGHGSGKSVLIKGLRIDGPHALRILLKGTVADLKDYVLKLQITDSRLPLAAIEELIPKAGAASGLIGLKGEVQGSLKNLESMFAKLNWDLKNVSIEHDTLSLKKMNGNIETLIGNKDGQTYLMRFQALSLQWEPAPIFGDDALPITINAQGRVEYKSKSLRGDISANLSELNVIPFMAASTANKQSEEEKNSAIDYRNSKLRFNITSPRIRTPYVDFTDAQANFEVGGPSHDLIIEKISGRALNGDLFFKGKVKWPAIEMSATGKDLSMVEVSKVVGKVSGKNLENSFFGKGDIEVQGTVANGLSTADFNGRAEIREGGFKFLPLPKKLLDQMRQVPRVADRLPLEKDTGEAKDLLEKAVAKFHLKADKLDLEVEAIDSFMAMTSKGFVTLGGHCEMQGVMHPKQKLIGTTVASLLADGIPFESGGDNWACSFSPELGDLAQRLVKAKALEHKDQVVDKVKDSLKGIIGK